MKHVCVLLNSTIRNDSRVIKVVRTLQSMPATAIDLFYINGTDEDKTLFGENVRLFSCEHKLTAKVRILRHTLFVNEFLFFVSHVLSTGLSYDFIYANDLPCLKPAAILKKKLGSKLIYDSHEIYIETLNQFLPIKASWPRRIVFGMLLYIMKYYGAKTERRLIRRADHFITVCESLSRYFAQKYNEQNVLVMMNCPSQQEQTDAVDFRSMLNLAPEKFIFIYQGCINRGRGLNLLLEAMQHADERAVLIFLGDGTMKPQLRKDCHDLNLGHKVFFLDTVSPSVLLSYTRGADCGVSLLETYNLSKAYAAPNKLFEYIHAGIPVIATLSLESQKVFSKYLIGILINNDVQVITIALNEMIAADTAFYCDYCRLAAQEYNWQQQEKVLFGIFNCK
jgi:glycosyltransferase involved in cell wall biosynthesis